MEKRFNTTGPVNMMGDVYRVDPLKRWNLEQVLSLIEYKKYFLLHAPRQTGKTSCLLALQEYLNTQGKYFAVYTNIEGGQISRDDVGIANRSTVRQLVSRLKKLNVDEEIVNTIDGLCNTNTPECLLADALSFLSSAIPKPIVILLDEIDALVGDGLISILRQLRANYDTRPKHYPSTVILCGVRDIQDYQTNTEEEKNTIVSAFNIKAASLILGNFSKDEVSELYGQHTTETGQIFADGCVEKVMEYTDGQPWLVNAIANQVTYEMEENRDRSVIITPDMIEDAKERLIIARQTHILQLADKLREERVRRVIGPMLAGELLSLQDDDADYCIDLGLCKRINGGLYIANEMYKEIIPRELAKLNQDKIPTEIPSSWRNSDDTINIKNLLILFKDYWYENMAIWGSNMPGYHEAAAQLVTQTFLHRIVNGGNEIHREYAVGRKRMDIFIKRKYYKGKNKTLKFQKIVLEVKTIKDDQNYETIRQKAIEQTAEYAKLKGVKEAQILLFNRGEKPRWTALDENEYAEYKKIKLVIWKL